MLSQFNACLAVNNIWYDLVVVFVEVLISNVILTAIKTIYKSLVNGKSFLFSLSEKNTSLDHFSGELQLNLPK